MKFKEMPGKAIEAMGDAAKAQLEARRQRIATPEFTASVEATRQEMYTNLRTAGLRGLESIARFLITAPAMAAWGLIKGPATIATDNGKKKKEDKSNPAWGLITGPIAGFTGELLKGGKLSAQMLMELGKAAGKKALIGARYATGI